MLHPAGYRGIRALALPTIDLVVRVIALVEHHTAVILVSQNVRCDPIQKPPIVGDDQRGTRKGQQRLLERTEGLDIQIISWLIEKQHIGTLL